MPTNTRPKTFYAQTDIAGEYMRGDVIPQGARLAQFLRFGDLFAATIKPAPADHPHPPKDKDN